MTAFVSSRRIGEADNPGPFCVGGAASSGHAIAQTGEDASHPRQSFLGGADTVEETSGLQLSGDVSEEIQWRWPIPVICRDTNYWHQSATRLMAYEEIIPFLQDELYGLEWSQHRLEEKLNEIYDTGRGVLDPAELVEGESWLDHCGQYGFADRPAPVRRPYEFPAPVSSPKQVDLLREFLSEAALREPAAASARAYMELSPETYAADHPALIENVVQESRSMSAAPIIGVGPAAPRRVRGPRRRRRTKRDCCSPGLAVLNSVPRYHAAEPPQRRSEPVNRKFVDVLTLNSSGRPQLLAAMQVPNGARIIACQEHHSHGAAFTDLQHDAKALGWVLVGAPATKTQREGSSAGVCIAVKKGISVGDIGGRFDLSPTASPGRLAGVWVQAGHDTGMLILSAYLHHTEGASLRNKAIIRAALAVATGYGSPWMIAGDFNCEPEAILSHWADSMEKANAYIVATAEPTHCPTTGTQRTLDFFICSSQVMDWTKNAQVDRGFEAAPHRAVRLSIEADTANHLVEVIAGPRMIPRELPIGCARSPVVPDWHLPPSHPRRPLSAVADRVAGGHEVSHEGDGHWPALMHAVENELCRINDLVDHEGFARASHCGRSEPVHTIKRLSLPQRTSAALGKICIYAHALVWLGRRLRELADISAKVSAGHPLPDGARDQWGRIMSKVSAPTGLPSIVEKIGERWREHMEVIRCHTPGRDTETLRTIGREALAVAADMKKSQLEKRAESWRNFSERQVASGAPAAHRLVKRDSTLADIIGTAAVQNVRTASPQAILEQDLAAWRKIWLRLGDAPTAPWRTAEVYSELPPISADDIRRAARTFPATTSIGCDAIAPSLLAHLSEPLREAIAALLNEIERTGRWPRELATSLIHLIPKPSGGRRPIGVLPTLVRIWERARKSLVQRWARESRRHYDWASQGRSAETAAWHQSLLDEAACADGLKSASVFFDLTKAFETIRLDLVWEAGIRHGFPLSLLRLSLEAFAFDRRLRFQTAVSDPTSTLSAVLAGGGFAQTAMLLVLLRPLDLLWDGFQNRGLSICVYVDDIALHASGSESSVAAVISGASDLLVTMLEDDVSMIVSRRSPWAGEGEGKSVATATGSVARRISTSMRRLGILVKAKNKHLGVHFAPGGRTRDLVGGSSRMASVVKRCARVARLGRRLGSHVFRTGIQPSVLYGASTALPRLKVVKQLRQVAARAIAPVSGRSITARLAVARCDPALEAVRKPIMAWVSTIWDTQALDHVMAKAWAFAQTTMAKTKRPSLSLGGAAGSFVGALRRIGWRTPSYSSVITRDNTVIDLRKVAPRTVLQYLNDDYAITAAASSDIIRQLCQGMPQGQGGGYACWQSDDGSFLCSKGMCLPWFEPAAAVLSSKWARGQAPEAIASVSALVEGGWWTQERLFYANLVADPFCRGCRISVGSLFHRCLGCPARAEEKQLHCPKSVSRAADPADPLYAQGVPRRPLCPPAAPEREVLIGQFPADGVLAAGEAFTDGAMRGCFSRAKRAGWAFVVAEAARPMWGKYGSIDEAYPCALRAELRALLEILRCTAGNLVIHVDNKEVVDGAAQGRAWCCEAKRIGADLWRLIWDSLDELSSVQIVKVKAHLRFSHVLDGRISARAWAGNAVADKWAKAGCEMAWKDSPCTSAHVRWHQAIAWYRWLVRVAATWIDDTAKSGPCPEGTRRTSQQGAIERSQSHRLGHEVWSRGPRAWCRKCGVSGTLTNGKPSVELRRECRGTMSERCAIQGRQFAIQPSRGVDDDGAISYADLAARGAQRLAFAGSLAAAFNAEAGGYADSEVVTHGQHGQSADVQVLPAVPSSSEDDPFGHNHRGFDDPGDAADEHAANPAAASGGLNEQGARESGMAASAMPDTLAVDSQSAGPQRQSAHATHSLRRSGHVVWCFRCGRHAAVRLGIGLLQECRGFAEGAYPARIRRLVERRHPITGLYL